MTNNKEKSTLNPEQLERAIQWLNQKTVSPLTCESCHHDKWMIGPDIVAPMPLIGNSYNLEEGLIPQFTITCTNCGNTKYYNAIIAGVVKDDENKDDD
ncbi:MAG: hypothetical protein AAGA64_16625 [Bacteroidota bacterium]